MEQKGIYNHIKNLKGDKHAEVVNDIKGLGC